MKQIKKVIHNGGYSHHALAPFLKKLGVSTYNCAGLGSHGVEAVQSIIFNLHTL